MKTVAGTLMFVNEDACCPPASVLPIRHAADAAGSGRGSRLDLQGVVGSDTRRDRQPTRSGTGGLRLRPDRGLRPVAADDLSSPPRTPRSGPRRGREPWNLGLLPARSRRDCPAARRVRAAGVTVALEIAAMTAG